MTTPSDDDDTAQIHLVSPPPAPVAPAAVLRMADLIKDTQRGRPGRHRLRGRTRVWTWPMRGAGRV